MAFGRLSPRGWYVPLCITLAGAGCRDTQPPPPHNRDLGGDGVLLLPTASAWYEAGIAEGKADWHPFREPQFDQPAAGVSPGGGEAGGSAPAVSDSQLSRRVESEIREMVDDYNGFVAEATVDGLLDYYLEEQHDALRPLFEAAVAAAGTRAEIRKLLESKLPADKQRIDAALGDLGVNAAGRLPIESITVLGGSAATGTVASGWIAPTCRFRLVDEDWYIEIPRLGDGTKLKSVLDAELTTYRTWLEGLKSGQTPAETVLQQLEQAARAASGRRQPGAEGGGTATEGGDSAGGD